MNYRICDLMIRNTDWVTLLSAYGMNLPSHKVRKSRYKTLDWNCKHENALTQNKLIPLAMCCWWVHCAHQNCWKVTYLIASYHVVLGGFFRYYAQLINSMRGIDVHNDFWLWPKYQRSFGHDFAIKLLKWCTFFMFVLQRQQLWQYSNNFWHN